MEANGSRACGHIGRTKLLFIFHLLRLLILLISAAAADTELNIPIGTPRLRVGHLNGWPIVTGKSVPQAGSQSFAVRLILRLETS